MDPSLTKATFALLPAHRSMCVWFFSSAAQEEKGAAVPLCTVVDADHVHQGQSRRRAVMFGLMQDDTG